MEERVSSYKPNDKSLLMVLNISTKSFALLQSKLLNCPTKKKQSPQVERKPKTYTFKEQKISHGELFFVP